MIKNILLPQDGSAHSRSALGYALWLAGKFEACLTGLYVVDIVSLEGPFIHDISASMGFEPFINFSTKMREVLEEKGKNILASFEEECARASIPCSDKRTSAGIVTNEICAMANLADLVVMGRHGVNEEFQHGLLGNTTEGVIRKSPKPVLVTPKEFRAPERPLLAYDGSQNASKAMHSAAEWAKTLGAPLTVISVSREGEGKGKGMKEARNYLKPYGIDASFAELAGDAPSLIEKYYRDNSHDLLFMGARRHSKIVEMVLGSTTEHLLRALPGPFFLER